MSSAALVCPYTLSFTITTLEAEFAAEYYRRQQHPDVCWGLFGCTTMLQLLGVFAKIFDHQTQNTSQAVTLLVLMTTLVPQLSMVLVAVLTPRAKYGTVRPIYFRLRLLWRGCWLLLLLSSKHAAKPACYAMRVVLFDVAFSPVFTSLHMRPLLADHVLLQAAVSLLGMTVLLRPNGTCVRLFKGISSGSNPHICAATYRSLQLIHSSLMTPVYSLLSPIKLLQPTARQLGAGVQEFYKVPCRPIVATWFVLVQLYGCNALSCIWQWRQRVHFLRQLPPQVLQVLSTEQRALMRSLDPWNPPVHAALKYAFAPLAATALLSIIIGTDIGLG